MRRIYLGESEGGSLLLAAALGTPCPSSGGGGPCLGGKWATVVPAAIQPQQAAIAQVETGGRCPCGKERRHPCRNSRRPLSWKGWTARRRLESLVAVGGIHSSRSMSRRQGLSFIHAAATVVLAAVGSRHLNHSVCRPSSLRGGRCTVGGGCSSGGPFQSYVSVFEPLKVFLQKYLKRTKSNSVDTEPPTTSHLTDSKATHQDSNHCPPAHWC